MYLPKRTVYLLWYLDIRVVVSMSMLHTVRVMLCTYVAAGCCVACDYKSILFAVHNYTCTTTYNLDTVQDFLCKLGIKRMYLVEISIFSLNHVIVRPTEIIKDLCKAST